MSKSDAVNTFGEGLIMDLNPLTTPNNVMTNCLNGTLITFNGNEFVLQNDMGNGRVETAKLPTGFVPVGVKEYGGIIYVASHNPQTNQNQIGCFPSPERNLTSDEIGNPNLHISSNDFKEGEKIVSYYKLLNCMVGDNYINPGDQFTVAIKSPTGIESYWGKTTKDLVTFHFVIIDDMGNINYIDDQFKVNGEYKFPTNFGGSSVEANRALFDQLQVYMGKKSGKLAIIIELETLDDFSVARSIRASKKKPITTGSTEVESSMENQKENPKAEDVEYSVKFYNSGWTDEPGTIKFQGVKFEGDGANSDFACSTPGETISYTWEGFKQSDIFHYKITPYTQLGLNSALARTGVIDFSLLGTGNIIMKEWRYYVDNDRIKINYGFDLNMLEGEGVDSVTFEFYDVYYGMVYEKKYTCSSSINGNFDGNFSETLYFKYDLKYPERYDPRKENKDYIFSEIGDRGSNLNHNELIKNSFYLVHICIKSRGLDQEKYNNTQAEKHFMRFMYTSNIFNKHYIENKIQNFSQIRVSPYDIKLTTSPKKGYEIAEIGGAKSNGILNPINHCPSKEYERLISEGELPTSYTANKYQDYRLDEASIEINTEVQNINDTFGDYNNRWLSYTGSHKVEEAKTEFDNSNQIIKKENNLVTSEISNYVDLTDGTIIEGENIDDVIQLKSDTQICNSDLMVFTGDMFFNPDDMQKLENKYLDILKEGDQIKIKKAQVQYDIYKSYFDRQVYYINEKGDPSSFEIKNPKEDKVDKITITFPDLYTRLTRRVGATAAKVQSDREVYEFGGITNPENDNDVIDNFIAGGSLSGNDTLLASKVIAHGGDKKAKGWTMFMSYENYTDPTFCSSSDSAKQDPKILFWNETRDKAMTLGQGNFNKGLSKAFLEKGLTHSFIIPVVGHGTYAKNAQEHNLYWRATRENPTFRSGLFMTGLYPGNAPNGVNRASQSTVYALCKMHNSSEESPEYIFINLAGRNMEDFLLSVKTIFNKVIWASRANRNIISQYASNVGYHDIFTTVLKYYLEFNSDNFTINESPIKLYESGKERPFQLDLIQKELNIPIDGISPESEYTTWKDMLENDKWYKDETKSELIQQCTYNNIPFPGISQADLREVFGDDVKNRLDLIFPPIDSIDGDNVVNIIYDDLGFVTIKGESGETSEVKVIDFRFELGGSIDVRDIASIYINSKDGVNNNTPSYMIHPNYTSTDATGQPLNPKKIYIDRRKSTTDPPELIDSSTDSARTLNVFGQEFNFQGLFTIVGNSLALQKVPSNWASDTEYAAESSNGGRKERQVDMKFYKGLDFGNRNTCLYYK